MSNFNDENNMSKIVLFKPNVAPDRRKNVINKIIDDINVSLQPENRLNDEERDKLCNIKWTDGKYLLNLESRSLLYEVMSTLQKHMLDGGSPASYIDMLNEIVSNSTPTKDSEFIFKLPIYTSSKLTYINDIERLKTKIEVGEGLYECPNCKSMKTIHSQTQGRSGDEPMTTKARCLNCGKSWVP